VTFALVADLPLGVYRGHLGDGDLDLVPSPARLHAALWCAAAQGPRAVLDGGVLTPSEADRASLVWLEANPPDGITVPRHRVTNDDGVVPGGGVAFRRQGLIVKEGGAWKDKVAGRDVGAAVTVDGPFAWIWRDDPPVDVRVSLEGLCPDVSHLGMAETPVRLRVVETSKGILAADGATGTTGNLTGPAEDVGSAVRGAGGALTYWLDLGADLFVGSGLDLAVPEAGRGVALEAAHRASSSPPKPREDRHSSSEETRRPAVVEAAVTTARYRDPRMNEAPRLPWVKVLLAPLARAVNERDRVRWCVAVHRALISLVGDGAPAILTGVYPETADRPANRLAIHILDRTVGFTGMTSHPATLALLVPAGTCDADLAVIGAALTRLTTVRGPGGREIRVAGRPVLVPADRLWPAVPADHQRAWRTATAFVPDSRPPRRGTWTLADAVAASVGLVWRDLLAESGTRGRGDVFIRGLADTAKEWGVLAGPITRVTDGDLTRYVHKVNQGHAIVPLRAELSLGSLAADRAAVAIGQSRHLGGGLLVPVDRPLDVEPIPAFTPDALAGRS